MLSPAERKKIGFPLLAGSTEIKKYGDVYFEFANNGYCKEVCENYADVLIDNAKKPAPFDIVQLASMYDRMHDSKMALFYLEMLTDKKMNSDERFEYCIEMLKALSKLGRWRDAEDFRTYNINFMQKHSEKVTLQRKAKLYMALALTDCAAKKYSQALKLLKFGYKPRGKNDTTLLEIFITVVYIFARAGDKDGLEGALGNAESCLNLLRDFDFLWQPDYYSNRIKEAAEGIL